MLEAATWKSHKILMLNTFAFVVCFAAWMVNGVLVTFLVDNQVFNWGPVQVGWLLGIPVLTGSLLRLPAGLLTDRYGGKPVFGSLLLLCAIPMYLLSKAHSFLAFALCSFGFGLAGVSFAIGIAFTSVWYPRERQGTALGIFGAGNAGAALTTMFAPTLLNRLTGNGTNMEGWRELPVYYAMVLAVTGVILFVFSENRKPPGSGKTFLKMLGPLKHMRVWRFGLYYFLVFGCFVAFSQWLVPYFVNVYYLSLVSAGLFAALFSLPSGLIRAVGGVLADKFGGRRLLYWVLGLSTAFSLMLTVPKMEIHSQGPGVMAQRNGVVKEVTDDHIIVEESRGAVGGVELHRYPIQERPHLAERSEREEHAETAGHVDTGAASDEGVEVFPAKESWQEPMVKPGQQVKKKELLAKGITRISFQANVYIFAGLVLLLGATWGVGMAAVFKLIPDYFPEEVGVVGGMVGVLGGLGGFACPIIFGYLLQWTGLWTSCWIFMLLLSVLCLVSLHYVVQKMMHEKYPEDMRTFER
jgi:MFS transporter, NNP family, nitrate/nitrite transporter